MKIHESYTKKDLVKIIQNYEINDIDLKLTRYDIVKLLIPKIKEYDLFFLEEENKNKTLTIKEKNDLIMKAQQIISLHKNGYIFERSEYENKEEVINEAILISNYGDISSVRRAVRFINEKYSLSINCKLSNDMEKKLNHKNKLKQQSVKSFHMKHGKVIVSFD